MSKICNDLIDTFFKYLYNVEQISKSRESKYTILYLLAKNISPAFFEHNLICREYFTNIILLK
jgi:hypothetical protein